MIIDELVAILGFDIRGEEKLRSFSASIEQTASRISAFAVAAGVAAAAGMAALGKSVMATTAEFEQYEATLTTIEGSTEKARKSLDWVADFAKTTPYEIGDVTQAFVRLKAYGLDPMDGSLKAAGDAGSAMGLGLMTGVEAIADAMTGENERLKAFGITTSVAGDKITYSWRENGKELNKTLKKNGVDIAKFLEENFDRRFGGAMDRQSRTWNGMVSNLADTWTNFQRSIGEAGFFDAMKGTLGRLSDYIAKLDRNGTLDRWARGFSRALETAASGVELVVTRIARHIEKAGELYDRHKDKLDGLRWSFVALGVYLFPVGAVIAAAALAIEDFFTYLEGGDSALGDFINSLAEFMGADPKKVADALGDIATAAAKVAATAVGIGLFAGALRKVGGALGLLGTKSAADGLSNLAKTGDAAGKAKGPKFGFMSILGLESAVEMGSGTLDEGKKRGESWNKWIEESLGTPRTFFERLLSEPARRDQPKTPYGSLARDPSAHGEALDGPVKPDVVKPVPTSQQRVQSERPAPKEVSAMPTIQQRVQNAAVNFGKMDAPKAAQAVNSTVNSTMNDNRNQAVSVNVGGVVVNGVQNVSGAVGAAVGSAVGNGAAGGAARKTWHEAGDKI